MPKVKDQDVEAALEGSEDERLVGGIQKIRRTRLPTEDRPGGKNKTPRRRESIFPEEIQAPAVVLPAVAVVKPPENKKEVKEVSNNNTQVTRPVFEICPLCGFFSKSASPYLTCKGCNDKFVAYHDGAIKQLARGGKIKVLGKIEWVLSQLDISRFEREWKEALQVRDNPATRIEERFLIVAKGQTLDQRSLAKLRVEIRGQILREDSLVAKRLFARLEVVKKLKPELEQKIAEAAAAPAASPTPASTVEAPVEPAADALTVIAATSVALSMVVDS